MQKRIQKDVGTNSIFAVRSRSGRTVDIDHYHPEFF